MPERAVRVVFDGHAVTPQRSGIGVWAYRLCNALLEHCAGRVELSVYACGTVIPVRTKDEFHHAVEHVREGSLYAVSHQWEIPRLLGNADDHLFHAPDFVAPLFPIRTPVLVTVHDIVPLVYPRLLARSKKTSVPGLYRAVLTASVRRSAAVLTVSEFTRSEIVRVLGLDAAKVVVAYPGPSIEVTGGRLSGNLAEQVCGKPYFLYVGRSDPYKGLPLLAAAYRRALDRAGDALPDLVLAGKRDVIARLKKHPLA
ncbi:MAG: glycosyltransferase, partial [Bacteroidota bacterium]|nr:glycosyltransferase [Bacteroidota bacterium]